MLQMTTQFVVPYGREGQTAMRVTGVVVRQMDVKENRRVRVAKLSKIINTLHKDTLARLAK